MSKNNSANRSNRSQRRGQVQTPETKKSPAKVLREELEAMSDAELDAKYEEVFGFKDEREFEREQVINSIIDALPPPPPDSLLPENKEVKGTKIVKDKKGKEWKITPDMKGLVVVRQAYVTELGGSMVVIPNTETLQTYTPEKFDELEEMDFFTESKMEIEILQDA